MGDHHLGYNAKLKFIKTKTTVPKIAQFFCINS